MAGPTGNCQATSHGVQSFTVFVKINFGYQVKITKTTTIIRCGENKSPTPNTQIFQYTQYAGSFNGNIRMVLNNAGTGYDPVPADLTRYNTEYDAKVQELNDAVAMDNSIIRTIESKTIPVTCVPAVRCPKTDAVMGTATTTKTEQTVKTLYTSGGSVSTSGGAICVFN